jgi:hypothetical protein
MSGRAVADGIEIVFGILLPINLATNSVAEGVVQSVHLDRGRKNYKRHLVRCVVEVAIQFRCEHTSIRSIYH